MSPEQIDAWFHVDGAYGLATLLLPELRDRFVGLERADSFIVDPHKWLFATAGSCALVYRDPALARQVHTQHGPYIDVLRTDDDAYNPCDLGYQLTRRASGLPIWFALALHGVDAHRTAIRHGIRLASAMADALEAEPLTELIMRPELGVVLFRRDRMGDRRVEGLGRSAASRRHRVRRPVDLQGRSRRSTGVHAPAHARVDHRRVDAQLVSGDVAALGVRSWPATPADHLVNVDMRIDPDDLQRRARAAVDPDELTTSSTSATVAGSVSVGCGESPQSIMNGSAQPNGPSSCGKVSSHSSSTPSGRRRDIAATSPSSTPAVRAAATISRSGCWRSNAPRDHRRSGELVDAERSRADGRRLRRVGPDHLEVGRPAERQQLVVRSLADVAAARCRRHAEQIGNG